jgi:hypothetical protein
MLARESGLLFPLDYALLDVNAVSVELSFRTVENQELSGS